MRPVTKGEWPCWTRAHRDSALPALAPVQYVFTDWSKAKAHLEERTGKYCHFCERRINNNLAVEHIKARYTHARLSSNWHNFLLICSSCNSRKSAGRLLPAYRKSYYWPHLNNTLLAFEYALAGLNALVVRPRTGLSPEQKARAQRSLDLYALDQPVKKNGEADERAVERAETLSMALELQTTYAGRPEEVRAIVMLVVSRGDFSLFLSIFKDHPEVCEAIINDPHFPGAALHFSAAHHPLPRNPTFTDPI